MGEKRKMRLSEAFDMYKNDYIRAKNQSSRVEEMHEYVKKSVVDFTNDEPLRKLSLDQITAWREQLLKSRSNNTVRGYIVRLRRVLSYCKERGYRCLAYNLVQVPQREEKIPTFLEPSEVSEIINQTDSLRTKFIIAILYSSGIRCTELCNLNRDQIIDRQFSLVGKGQKVRPCFIDERTEELMEEYLKTRKDRNPALIVTNQCRRMRRGNVELIVRIAVKKAGLEKRVTPHTFRHSYATDLLKHGMNIRSLADCMGHASLDTTRVYTHIVNEELFIQYQKSHTI